MKPREEFVESIIHKYEHSVAPLMFIFGFIFDTLTMKRIDLWFDHIVLLTYLTVAGVGILVLNVHESNKLRIRHSDSIIPFVPILIQFAFGGLFSFFVIFYIKSGTFAKSWLFLVVLLVLWIGNEHFRLRYQRLVFQLSIYFTVLFSYAIFVVPLVLKKIGDGIFIISGMVSLGLITLFCLAIWHFTPKQVSENRNRIIQSIGSIFILFNILYFTNIIPPIPLALKENGIYHSVTIKNGIYEVTYEKAPWYLFFQSTDSTYHWKEGELVYYFSAVFAPTKINTTILHHWFYYDETLGSWTDQGSIQFPITGGRDGGYRGYSFKTGIIPGKWRVDVENSSGQILGRQVFTIEKTTETPQLEYNTR